MKRSAALASLSRDHHQALVAAQKLKRATSERTGEVREGFLAYWRGGGLRHFQLEEEMLLPGYAEYGNPHHPLVLAVLGDHVEIRQMADALAEDPEAGIEALQRLGERMASHVRLEERELFPMIEEAMPEDRLAALAETLTKAEAESRD